MPRLYRMRARPAHNVPAVCSVSQRSERQDMRVLRRCPVTAPRGHFRRDLRPGDVLRYEPSSTWCRDGYTIAEPQRDGTVVLRDTYWTSSTGFDTVNPETTALEFLFNLGDYDEVPAWKWEKFAPGDRQMVPKHSGYHSLFLVRKGATPDLATQIENARERVADAEAKLRSAQHDLDWRRRELAELEAKDGNS